MYKISIMTKIGAAPAMLSLTTAISLRPHKLSPAAILIDTPHVLYCENIAVTRTAVGYDQAQQFFFLTITNLESGRTKYYKIFGLPKQLQNILYRDYPLQPGFPSPRTVVGSSDSPRAEHRHRDWQSRRGAYLAVP